MIYCNLLLTDMLSSLSKFPRIMPAIPPTLASIATVFSISGYTSNNRRTNLRSPHVCQIHVSLDNLMAVFN